MGVATLLALAAAVLHASWNLLIKTADDRETAAWGQFVFGGVALLPVLLFTGLPPTDAWVFLGASALVHLVYVYALVNAYEHGDFSLVYPLARGGGALVAALLGAAVLGDALPTGAWISLLVVAIGLGSLVRPGAPRAEVGFALLTAIVIGGYTVIDTAGSRHSTNGFAYGVVLTMLSGVVLTGALVVRGRAGDAWRSARTDAPRHLVSGLCLATAYSLVLVAVRFAPIGYVATLRESSVVIGALLGWLLLHERLGGRRLVSSVVVTVGLVGLVVLQ